MRDSPRARKELAGIFGVGLGVEQLVEGVKAIAELGEKTVNTAAAVGLSTEKFSLMADAMKLVGGDAELATRSLITLAEKSRGGARQPVEPSARGVPRDAPFDRRPEGAG